MISLAISIHARPGVYALLIGSGVSCAAGIPTGWEITVDLIRKYACLLKEDCEPDPAAWYQDKYHEAPDYSKILGGLAKTPAERSQILRGYFEPTDEERENGLKIPTNAHGAIARLTAKGKIRVIITTNFDRLIEQALEAENVTPSVISNVDTLSGVLPYVHTPCTVVKVHGDYLDTRIRNTIDELSVYHPDTKTFLSRVFDEFGLLICGWSAEWDVALRTAITRYPNRRFTTFWTVKDELGEAGKQLAQQRDAQMIPIRDADTFFSELSDKLEALEKFKRPHPLSAKLAVTQVKKYLSEDKYRIQLEDSIGDETERLAAETSEKRYPVQVSELTNETFFERVKQFQAHSEILASMVATASNYGTSSVVPILRASLERLASFENESGHTALLHLRRYPCATHFIRCWNLRALQKSL